MSVFKLQEHWEGNKELLPVLEPALITHTGKVLIIKYFLNFLMSHIPIIFNCFFPDRFGEVFVGY